MFGFLQGVILGIILSVVFWYVSLFYLNRRFLSKDESPSEHKMSKILFELGAASSRDGWFNHLFHFLYREFRYADVLHNFALKKLKIELEDIKNGPAKNILSKLDLHSYNFGSEFPVFEHFKLTDPEGFDPYELPNSISIDFDVNYDAFDYCNDSKTNPFQVSAVAVITKSILNSKITVKITIRKIHGRMRIRLSRDPSPYWYASFVDRPKLDIKVETDLNSRYATTIEDLFSRHLERMVMRRHVVPNFKVRYAPFFSPKNFDFSTSDYDCFDFNYSSTMKVTVCSGRSFATKFAKDTPSSSCFVTLLLSENNWENTLLNPKTQFCETQTSEPTIEASPENIVDDFVNLSVEEIDAESKAITDCADETKTEEKIQQGLQSKRTRILAFGKGLKEMAKEKVKEKIEPVMKNRRMRNDTQASSSPDLSSPHVTKDSSEKSDKSLLDSPTPSTGIRRRHRRQTEQTEDAEVPNEAFYNIISAQKDFYRTNYAALSNDSYNWEWQKCSKQLNPRSNFLLIGVWEKKNARSQNILIGRAEISMQQIFAKASQAHDKTFIRKIFLADPGGLKDLKERIDPVLFENRGFREELSFGELVLKIQIASDEDKENLVENQPTQTEPVEPATDSRRNIVGNIKKFWNKAPDQKPLLTERSRSDSSLSLNSIKKVESTDSAPEDNDEFFDTDQANEDSEGVEMATTLDEKDQHLYDAAKNSGNLAAKNQHDMLAAFAKEEGKQLHRDLPEDERKFEIEHSIAKIENEIDAEITRKNALVAELKTENNPIKRAKGETSLQKCKDRLDSLNVLHMHHRSGMEDANSPRNSPEN